MQEVLSRRQTWPQCGLKPHIEEERHNEKFTACDGDLDSLTAGTAPFATAFHRCRRRSDKGKADIREVLHGVSRATWEGGWAGGKHAQAATCRLHQCNKQEEVRGQLEGSG